MTWGPDALPHVEARLTDAIENWGVRYFKWDFMAWLDCAGQGDIYTFREALLAMLDRLQAKYPDVTFQIDETNDYRLFPYESVARGPSWFQNGSPEYRPAAPQPLEPEPVRAGLVARPALPRRQGLGEAPGRDADGGRAPLPPHVLQRPARAARRGDRAGAPVARPLQAPPRAVHADDLPAPGRPARAEAGPRSSRGTRAAGGARCSRSASRTSGRRSRSRCATCRAAQRFELLRGAEEEPLGTVGSRTLREGLTVELPEKDTAAVILIRRVRG